MSSFKKEVINENIIHLIFKSQKSLCESMVRIEEFYESPEFAGKTFSLSEYKTWYIKNYGQWSYYSDWSGFNIPGDKVSSFKKVNPKLRLWEKAILKELPLNKKFYLIATYEGGRNDILDHEIAHAMFYLNPEYKNEMTNLVNENLKEFEGFVAWIRKNYNNNVLIDELQAYLSNTTLEWFKSNNISFSNQKLLDNFNKIYKKYL